ncbi:unnamed protein product [Adineta steineri]|uniref:Uncharacterized protein n=1 Tax=Adineta steineri TaxID=433720 RepID=A0A815U0D3_9BILA|nr:unnamed protein product [Adineta steineri]CAF1514161.1 unnamed protein product [Adineta steineri]CAF1596348.1 unnamed protein product [Adineta steineri]CAF1596399.1 unnamed protein product [Adineta steineri]
MRSFSGIINPYYPIDDIPCNDDIIIINNKSERNLFKRIILILAIGIICIFILMTITTKVIITLKEKKSINFNYRNSSLDHNNIISNISKPLEQNNSSLNKTESILNISKPLEQNNLALNKTEIISNISKPLKHNISVNCQLPFNPNYTKDGITVAGNFSPTIDELEKLQGPTSVYLDREQNIYVADTASHRIRKYLPGVSDEGETLIDEKSNINSPCCLYIDQESNNLYFLDQDGQGNYRVQLIRLNVNPLKSIILLVGNQTISHGMKLDQYFNIYVSEFNHHRIVKWLAPDYDQYLIVVENNENQFIYPRSIYIDEKTNNLYVANQNRIQRWSMNSKESKIVMQGGASCPNGIEYDCHGNLYISQGTTIKLINNKTDLRGFIIIGVDYDFGMQAARTSTDFLYNPEGIYLDKTNGDFYLADSGFNRIQKFTIKN